MAIGLLRATATHALVLTSSFVYMLCGENDTGLHIYMLNLYHVFCSVFDVRYGQHESWLCAILAAACTATGYAGTAGSCTCAAGYEGTVTYDVATGATSGCTGKRIYQVVYTRHNPSWIVFSGLFLFFRVCWRCMWARVSLVGYMQKCACVTW